MQCLESRLDWEFRMTWGQECVNLRRINSRYMVAPPIRGVVSRAVYVRCRVSHHVQTNSVVWRDSHSSTSTTGSSCIRKLKHVFNSNVQSSVALFNAHVYKLWLLREQHDANIGFIYTLKFRRFMQMMININELVSKQGKIGFVYPTRNCNRLTPVNIIHVNII